MRPIPLDDIDEDDICFYDLETTHQYAPYTHLRVIAVQYGLKAEPFIIHSKSDKRNFRTFLRDKSKYTVAFNCVNFDDIVLSHYGYRIAFQNHHDVFLMAKTVAPVLPAYSQKYLSFYYFADPHFAEQDLHQWCKENHKEMHEAPPEIMNPYALHDIHQLVKLFRLFHDIVIRPEHWPAYQLDRKMGPPLREIIFKGGMYIDRQGSWKLLQSLQKTQQQLAKKAAEISQGRVTNPNSSKQMGQYLTEFERIELEFTESGEFAVNKKALTSLREDVPIADIAFRYREAMGTIKFLDNFLEALDDPTFQNRGDWIPQSVSVSAAKTRRFTSSSKYKINFQNLNEQAKSVQLIPPGYLGVFIDATQIENVVHIYESADYTRRKAYEADEGWNEYVWLCNQILGGDHTKDELDDKENPAMRSPRNPNWTIYKEFKTGKLAINFGMGLRKFCNLFGLGIEAGEETFTQIHEACPAIRNLQNRVALDLKEKGYVYDVFGHRYSGPVEKAYKVVAYLIQGCGTGSLPKAQIRANWETLQRYRRMKDINGVLCGTTHDETEIRIDLGTDNTKGVLQLLQELMFNMTEKFSPKFDGIPLRAKMRLSRTNAAEAKQVDPYNTKEVLAYL